MGIDQLQGERIETDTVDGQVAPTRGGGEVELGVGLDDEAAVAGSRIAVAARQGEVDLEPLDSQYPEDAPDRDDRAEPGQDPLEGVQIEAIDLDVGVLGLDPEQTVAHPASDHQSASARLGDGRHEGGGGHADEGDAFGSAGQLCPAGGGRRKRREPGGAATEPGAPG